MASRTRASRRSSRCGSTTACFGQPFQQPIRLRSRTASDSRLSRNGCTDSMPKPASISGANGNDLRGKRILVAGIKGPAGFPAQFLPDTPPFKTLEDICKWFADLFHTGVLIPGGDRRVIDIDLAATSPTYCDSSGPSLLVSDVAVAEVPAY